MNYKILKSAASLLVVASFMTSVQSAGAATITSLPGGVAQPMPALNYFGTGPQAFGSGVTWTPTSGFSVFGFTNGYAFNANGNWSGTPMAGTNHFSGSNENWFGDGYNQVYNTGGISAVTFRQIEVVENQSVPEPATITLIAMALLSLFGLGLTRRRAEA